MTGRSSPRQAIGLHIPLHVVAELHSFDTLNLNRRFIVLAGDESVTTTANSE
jgi:hypothetical protein